MLRTSCLALMLALTVAACGNDDTPTTPSTANTAPKFTATLSPANEVPAVSNADVSGSGVATITLNLTKDSAGNITAATADFQVNMNGFPAGTTLTGAHIHPGASGTTGGVVWNSTIASGDVVLANGRRIVFKVEPQRHGCGDARPGDHQQPCGLLFQHPHDDQRRRRRPRSARALELVPERICVGAAFSRQLSESVKKHDV